MPTHHETRSLPYPPEKVFELVADVERYPEFLPWCAAARIRSRATDGPVETLAADLVISFKVFRERFGSTVRLNRDAGRIDTEYLDGPFKYMKSFWQIEAAEGGAKTTFFVDFEMKNIILEKAVGLMFNQAMQRIVAAFEARAKDLYG